MATQLSRIAEMAKADPDLKFTSIGHFINEQTLMESHEMMEPNKATGVDRVTKEMYGKDLETNIGKLVERLKQKSYRPLPARRTYIPKDEKSMRPLGIPAYEDKLVQHALKQVLEAIYEQDFLDVSYGFRPNRSMHDALKRLNATIEKGKISYIVDADIKGFFNHVDHEWLMTFLGLRIGDPNILRLVRRMLKAGISENGTFEPTEEGTPQGSVVSPLLANVYLHYALDLWFVKRIKERCRGQAEIIRFADDFVCCFEYRDDAEQFYVALIQRLRKFNLNIAEEKTKIIAFGRYAQGQSKREGKKKPETFDFLGFTHYCSKSRTGNFRVKRQTSKKKFKQKVKAMKMWIKENRHKDQEEFLKILRSKLKGHYNYYGITDNSRKMWLYYYKTVHLMFKWLNRRSQRQSFTKEKFFNLREVFRLPKPRITINIYNLTTR